MVRICPYPCTRRPTHRFAGTSDTATTLSQLTTKLSCKVTMNCWKYRFHCTVELHGIVSSQAAEYDRLILLRVLFFSRVDKQDDAGEHEQSEGAPA